MIASIIARSRASPTGSTASRRRSAARSCWCTGASTSCPRGWAGCSPRRSSSCSSARSTTRSRSGFVLTFLLAGMGLAGMVHTARNLARIAVSAGRAEPVFAGESAQFRLYLDGARRVRAAGDPRAPSRRRARSSWSTLPPGALAEVVLAVPAPRARLAAARARDARDALPARPVPRLELRRARRALPRLSAPGALAPAALQRRGILPARCARRPRATTTSPGCAATSSPTRRATWRGRRSRAATTCSPSSSPARRRRELWLDWRSLGVGFDVEQRLSRLAGWVLAAERAGTRYGLRLPGRGDRARPRRCAPHRLPAGARAAPGAGTMTPSAHPLAPEVRLASTRDLAWLIGSLAARDRAARDCVRRGG